MKLTITTTHGQVEKANYLLAQAVKSIQRHPELLEALDLTKSDLDQITQFRKRLLNAYLAQPPKTKP